MNDAYDTCVFGVARSISCCRVSVKDRTGQLYSFVPSVGSQICWVCDRSRGSARLRAICRRRRSDRSCDAARARSPRDVGASAPSATAARRGISVCPYADSPAASSALSENKDRSSIENESRTRRAHFQL